MASRPGTPALLRELNERSVLEVVRVAAPVSRAEVARTSGLSKPTVSLSLESLLAAGLVREVGTSSGRPGRSALLFEPVAEAGLVLGVDIGARFVRVAVADLAGAVLARRDLPLPAPRLDVALGLVAGVLPVLVGEAEADAAIVAATVGVPAAVAGPGEPAWLGALEGMDGVDLVGAVREQLGLDATVENDVNLAAIGELGMGAGRDVADFVFISVGTGLGAGLVLGGELHRGARGAAGELDLVPFDRTGTAASLDTDPSRHGLSSLLERLVGEGVGLEGLSPASEVQEIFEAARAGNPTARRIVEEEVRRIALHIAAVSAVVDPELVVLGGGIGASPALPLAEIRSHLATLVPRPPRVETSSLGDGAILAGALAVARRRGLDEVFDRRIVRERTGA
jgi:predicted NBD/HSP70 family sugar kinase